MNKIDVESLGEHGIQLESNQTERRGELKDR